MTSGGSKIRRAYSTIKVTQISKSTVHAIDVELKTGRKNGYFISNFIFCATPWTRLTFDLSKIKVTLYLIYLLFM